jgi:hypothetical protein
MSGISRNEKNIDDFFSRTPPGIHTHEYRLNTMNYAHLSSADALCMINRERIMLCPPNRWDVEMTPAVLEAMRQEKIELKRLRALETEIKLKERLLKDPNWIPRVPKPRAPKTHTTKTLSAAKLDVVNEDHCGICMESHTLRDSVHTSCGHCFGSVCYEIMLQHKNNSACPMCRNSNPTLTFYKARAKKVK